MDIEICVESFDEAKLAAQFVVKRIELCSGLDIGGLTPSTGLIRECTNLSPEVHVLIRPRGGDFCYNAQEIMIMEHDITVSKECGAKGVVIGVLSDNGILNIAANAQLIRLAKSLDLEVTFHRAFDLTQDPIQVVERLIELGFDRLLTSGQKLTAIEGNDLIQKLVKHVDGKIQIMAGSGVAKENVNQLLASGVDAIHFSSRKKLKVTPLNMGSQYVPDLEKIAAILNQIKS